MNDSVYKNELVETAKRAHFRIPARRLDPFVAALERLPAERVEVVFGDVDELARAYEVRRQGLRERGVAVPGLGEAVELLRSLDYIDPVRVLPLQTEDVNFTAFFDERALVLLELVAVPASLSAPTPPPGVPAP